ncbi:1-acyl-sn-glycerol-3-phosphate acyltransferase [Pseudozobellia thermophila]|uniref:Phospholipid/glycerol acyltransferase domain-containing protein n=1 Tax=Pseudozobellia thermophila TaxID=192903 RepID=A0A1M6CJL9_9FLAO|nr:1-acyl-sn-glycerol-3-phosphate acyltransferase [Pseudozobellia thermophila]SHI61169.1 hypothetical protein SAMN04488513_101786 [Pseudozobellia thermophila]
MGDFFFSTYSWIAKRRWLALAGFLVLLLGLATTVGRIEFDDDISSLIPVTEETKRVQELLKSITFTDKIVVNIRKRENGTTEGLIQYATAFLDSIQSRQGTYIKDIQGKIGDDVLQNTLDLVYDHLPLFLEAEDYETIQRKLTKDSIAAITKSNYRTLISPTGIVAKKTIVKDPLGISFMGLKKLQKLGFGDGFKIKDGFLLDKDEHNILLFITPKFGSNETNKNLPFSEALYDIQAHLNQKYANAVESEYFGAALSAVSNATQIKRDIQFTVSIAMTLLIILLMVFYRKVALPLILFAPAFFGGLLALAVLCLVRAKISAISLGIGSVLIGVTLDYGLHILTHLREGNSIKSVYREVAPAVLMSSLTTASAFLCLLFLDSQALQDLGIFAAVSVSGASCFALLFIPLVYRPKKAILAKPTLLDRLAAYEFHRSKWAISGLAAIFIISIFTYKKVLFNKDIAKLNYETQALIDARQRLEKLTDMGSKSIYLATFGNKLQEVLLQNDSIYRKLERLKENGQVVSFGSIGTLAKSDRSQEKEIEAWKTFWSAQKVAALKKNLIESGKELGFKENTFRQFYALLEKEFSPLGLDDLTNVRALSIDDYVVSDGNGTTITSLVKVRDSAMGRVRAQFEQMPNTLLIDRQQVNETFLGNLKNDFNELLGYSLIAVLLILYLFYRSFVLTLITAVPIFLTWFFTVGIMGLLHLEFNIFNIIICSFIFGLGVDYSIFITNGLLTEYRLGEKALATHKTSIILSVITTIAGVGVLIFAKHPVLYTISSVSLIGILCAALTAFIVQPLLFRLFIGDRTKRPIQPRILLHSLFSFAYFDLGGLLLSVYAWIYLKLDPKAYLKPHYRLHKVTSLFMKSVLYTNPFTAKKIINPDRETFEKPALLIANHSSFLDILVMGMLHPKLIYLVKDHVYNSKTIGSAARLSGAYPVSGGIENSEAYLRQKLEQGFSIIAFPEGSRSTSNKVGRFHKGAFYLAQQFDLDILPVMIHGGSEVSPKGSFIIRDGSLSAKILHRVPPGDKRFGATYSQRAKQFGTYFRAEFRKFRKEMEPASYWHKTLLENFRYKGPHIYKRVRDDLGRRGSDYHQLAHTLGEKDRIAYISENNVHLPLLLALDSIDRKIFAYVEDPEARAILSNHYLTHRYSKITVLDTDEKALTETVEVLLVESKHIEHKAVTDKKLAEIAILIVINEGKRPSNLPGFTVLLQNDTFIMFKRNT